MNTTQIKRVTFPSGIYFVRTDKDVINSLFEDKQTASGTFKRFKRGVMFYDMQKNPLFYLVCNKYGERFFVSCGKHNGKTFYMHALTNTTEKLLGFDTMKYSDEAYFARSIGTDFDF